jgi:hypothetical protein
MRFIKLIVISFVIIVILVTGVSLLFPSTVIVSRAINIRAPKDSVFEYVKNFNGWKQWIVGLKDSSVTIFSNTQANLAGTNVVITNSDTSSVHSVWTSKRGKTMEGDIHLFNNPQSPNITVVQWQFQQKLKWYPWEKFASLMGDKIMSPMMESNLLLLQKAVEKMP